MGLPQPLRPALLYLLTQFHSPEMADAWASIEDYPTYLAEMRELIRRMHDDADLKWIKREVHRQMMVSWHRQRLAELEAA